MAEKAKAPTKALATVASESQVAALASEFPTEPSFTRKQFPRIAFKSQDVMEGVGKSKKVVIEAGTFFIERPELDADEQPVLGEDGKPNWLSEELGTEIEGVIAFQRKQLKYFDQDTNSFTSSPIYDNDTEIIPLFRDGAEIDRGTAPELRAREEYASVSKKSGKPVSLLEETRVLYVIYEGELYQLNLRGTSMYAYMSYARKVRPAVPAVMTHFSSEPKENGNIEWNQMTFDAVRPLAAKEAAIVIEQQTALKDGIAEEKQFFASKEVESQPAQGISAREFAAYKSKEEQ